VPSLRLSVVVALAGRWGAAPLHATEVRTSARTELCLSLRRWGQLRKGSGVSEEPVEWTDEASGLLCCVLRGPVGALNGYVAINRTHPWFGRGYDDHLPLRCPKIETEGGSCYEHSPSYLVGVHGGLTYAGEGVEGSSKGDDLWWFGFDCAHAGDFIPGLSGDSPGDGEQVCDLPYVQSECRRLAMQLAAVTS
jgi:hypothetical protein